jgi:hypothetical protein
MKVLLEFEGSHHYFMDWVKTVYYCPNCGKREVWEESGAGDFYESRELCCTECNLIFTMPSMNVRKDAWSMIPEQLKKGVTFKPKTPKGN